MSIFIIIISILITLCLSYLLIKNSDFKNIWTPKEVWFWANENTTKDHGNITVLKISKEEQDRAIESFDKWQKENPAPTWYKIWCKIFKIPTHRGYCSLGESYGAVPRVIDNVTLILEGNVKLRAVNRPAIYAKNHSAIIFDGGPEEISSASNR